MENENWKPFFPHNQKVRHGRSVISKVYKHVLLLLVVLSLGSADEICSACKCGLDFAICTSTLLRAPLTDTPPYVRHLAVRASDASAMFEVPSNLTSLEHVHVVDSRLERLPADALVLLERLRFMEIANTGLNQIPATLFFQNRRLNTIGLSHNKLRTISSRTFSILPDIIYLYLNHNELRFIEENTFTSNSKLQQLDISFNRISSIPPFAFNISNVRDINNRKSNVYINMSDNALMVIPDYAFFSCPHLQELDVSRNRLEILQPRAFEGLSGLRVLDLRGNVLKELPGDVFSSLGALSRLLLSGNRLRRLHADSFRGLEALTELHLDGNALRSLDAVFSRLHTTPLPRLTLLNASGNALERVGPRSFGGCPALERLDLSRNAVAEVADGAFEGSEGLRELSLRGNPLRRLTCEALRCLRSLRTLLADEGVVGGAAACEQTPPCLRRHRDASQAEKMLKSRNHADFLK